MKAREGTAPTRMNLARARRRLGRVDRGIALLRRKREALIAELFHQARPAAEARDAMTRQADRAYPALFRALAVRGEVDLRFMGQPARDLPVEVRAGQVWGISTSELVSKPSLKRSLEARGTAPSGLGPASVQAAEEFETLLDLLLDAAPREMLIRRLGEALTRTSRQVNSLERRVSPALRAGVTRMRHALEEREREERVRLRLLSAQR